MTLHYTQLEMLCEQYDGFLIDQFGVLLNGDGPYPGATLALEYLHDQGKRVVILSNSGKRSEANCARLVSHGFARHLFETVLSSGEVAWERIRREIGKSIPRNGSVFVMIKDGDIDPLVGLELNRTDNAKMADLLVIVSRDPVRVLSSYKNELESLSERNIPCYCLNPDKQMLVTSGGLIESAGHIADIYASLGGVVTWFGKPYAVVYEEAKKLLKPLNDNQILCIGDSLEHDIKGGGDASLSTALVRTGVLSRHNDDAIMRMFEEIHEPDYILDQFTLEFASSREIGTRLE
ncbi:MAG: TIGR01459 family HAD-type hydrolase [Litoreibacter sp.]|nr:TIGR01459 family HAD-type hydrolase [Litoreibacter sp.]